VIRDVTDIDHPSTVATVGVSGGLHGVGFEIPSFVSASVMSYLSDSRRVMRSQLSGSGSQVVAVGCGDETIGGFGWSPDGQSLTYLVEPSDWGPTHAFQWHLISGGVDRVIGTVPTFCHCGNGSEDFSLDVGFSPDGQLVWVVAFTGKGTNLQVRRLDGSLVGDEIRVDQGYPSPVTMGVWSGADFFFRDSQGVERWREGTIKQFLPEVSWLRPRASPNGGQIVYAARGSDGGAHVYVVDTSNGRARQLSSRQANSPFFLSSRYVWYKGERLCAIASGDPCYFNIKSVPTGKTYIYDVQTGTEWESIITDVFDVWPHGA
jgi:WD40 repeat protein